MNSMLLWNLASPGKTPCRNSSSCGFPTITPPAAPRASQNPPPPSPTTISPSVASSTPSPTALYWDDTAILILEDDAQDGPDHVDSHRSIALVISKYAPLPAIR